MIEDLTPDHSYAEGLAVQARAVAIAEGMLLDARAISREAGLAMPVYITSELWDGYLCPDEAARANDETAHGRAFDLLFAYQLSHCGDDLPGLRFTHQVEVDCEPLAFNVDVTSELDGALVFGLGGER